MSDLRNFIKNTIRKCLNEQNISSEDKLKSKLLSFGGNNVELGLDTEEEELNLLNNGRIYNEKITFTNGTPNRCHRNVSDKYKKLQKIILKL